MENRRKKSNHIGYRLGKYPRAFFNEWLFVLAMLLAGAGLSFVVCFGALPAHFESTATIYAPEEFLTGTAALAENDTILKKVLAAAGEEESLTTEQLRKRITAAASSSTVLTVTVWSEDPYEAKEMVNALGTELCDMAESEFSTEIKLLAAGTVPTERAFPVLWKTLVFGAAAGLLLTALILAFAVLRDDIIYNEKDLERYSGLPVLAVISGHEEAKKETGDAAGTEKN